MAETNQEDKGSEEHQAALQLQESSNVCMPLRSAEKPIAAPSLGDIKLKIHIP